MTQFMKRNATTMCLTFLVAVVIAMWSVIGVAIASSSPSERNQTEISDTEMPEPGPGIGMNGKFNPNLLGTAPGL